MAKTGDIFFNVMICCYNSEKYIRETIDSVINQTYKNWKMVIVNDGSTDKSGEIVLEYKNKGVPIIYFEQENEGFAAARNKAMELADGEWIAIIDSDDVCLPERLEIQAGHIRDNPGAGLFFADTVHFGNDGAQIRRQFEKFNPCGIDLSRVKAMNRLLVHGCFIDTEAVVFNKKAAVSIGGFDTAYKFAVDYDFFIRMGKNFDFYAGKELVSKWRVHGEQLTQKIRPKIFGEMRRVFLKYFFHSQVTFGTRLEIVSNVARYMLKKSVGRGS